MSITLESLYSTRLMNSLISHVLDISMNKKSSDKQSQPSSSIIIYSTVWEFSGWILSYDSIFDLIVDLRKLGFSIVISRWWRATQGKITAKTDERGLLVLSSITVQLWNCSGSYAISTWYCIWKHETSDPIPLSFRRRNNVKMWREMRIF